MAGRGTPKTVDELLAQARTTLPHRPSPAEALRAQAGGALLIDIRGDDQRRDGLLPGAIVIPHNSLEWRCDPASVWRHPAIGFVNLIRPHRSTADSSHRRSPQWARRGPLDRLPKLAG